MYLKVVLSFQIPTKHNSTGDTQIRNKLLSYVRTCHPCFKEVSVSRHPVLFPVILTNSMETIGRICICFFLKSWCKQSYHKHNWQSLVTFWIYSDAKVLEKIFCLWPHYGFTSWNDFFTRQLQLNACSVVPQLITKLLSMLVNQHHLMQA